MEPPPPTWRWAREARQANRAALKAAAYLETSFFLQVDSLKGRMVAKTTNTETELLPRALEPALKSFLANKLDKLDCQLPHSLDIREM